MKQKINYLLKASLGVALAAVVASCGNKTIVTDLAKENLIPKPVSVTATNSSFELTDKTDIYVAGGDEELMKIGQLLADQLNPATGLAIEVKAAEQEAPKGSILLTLTNDGDLGNEGYQLTITEKQVKLEANQPAGLINGLQTIRQLLPAAIEMKSTQQGPWHLATGTIRDYPEFGYRGAMLDVARHFFGVDDVKKFIDYISAYKMNVLHLHLSDDQGWRIEIKSWPNLTAHGGTTQVGGGAGGFYTQEQYSDIVKYAAERNVLVIPEIDMPGHTNAALASYPELNCSGKATELYTGTEVGFSTLCTQNEVTYKFIDDVIRELAAITPGQYIHVGGDESHVTKIEDYIPFINRVQDIVYAHGKTMIGWDEVALATLKPTSVAQFWAKEENAKAAVAQGAKVIVSPAKKAYLDMQYDSTSVFGLHWAAYIEVDAAYNWDPATYTPGVTKENIVGVEAPLWSETIAKLDEVEYLVFPRLPGIAEVAWTKPELRNWDEYKARLAAHGPRFKAQDINYYPSTLVPWKE